MPKRDRYSYDKQAAISATVSDYLRGMLERQEMMKAPEEKKYLVDFVGPQGAKGKRLVGASELEGGLITSQEADFTQEATQRVQMFQALHGEDLSKDTFIQDLLGEGTTKDEVGLIGEYLKSKAPTPESKDLVQVELPDGTKIYMPKKKGAVAKQSTNPKAKINALREKWIGTGEEQVVSEESGKYYTQDKYGEKEIKESEYIRAVNKNRMIRASKKSYENQIKALGGNLDLLEPSEKPKGEYDQDRYRKEFKIN